MDVDEDIETVNVENDDDILWSIEDDTLFQPCGLICHSSSSNNKTKSVFVTWNEYYLLNYRFKKSKKTNRMEMTKVRIPLPKGSHLRSIHMLEYNTLLLMSDGRVHCFGSIKSLHLISWLRGVRAFARTHEGFSVVRYDDDTQKLLLQVYVDLPSLGKGDSTLQYSYDITYDEQNIFQCDWQNDSYTLLTVTVTQEHEKFMQCLFGAAAVADKQIHLFSIAGHIFALTPQEADDDENVDTELAYHIELICIYTTSVLFMRLLPAQNLCLVYLSCGTVDIWYMSQLIGIKQRQMHYTGSEWLDFDASCDNGDFYYTDGEQLVRLRFQYDAQLDDCQVQRCVKSVPGMQACAWVQHIEQLVCLSDNNIFYRIAFSVDQLSDESADTEPGVMRDLTPTAMDQLRRNAQVLQQYEKQPNELMAAIQREYEKQQLVAVARNEASFEGSLEATLEFRRQLPLFGVEVLLLHTARQAQLDSTGIYAILQLRFNDCQKLLNSSHWQLMVYHGHNVHVHRIPTDLLLSRKCKIIIPLKKVFKERLPEFTIKLVAFLELHTQLSAVLLPFQVQEHGDTYRALFSGQLCSLNLFNKPKLSDILLKPIKRKMPKVEHKMLSPCCLSLEQIADICNANVRIENNMLDLYFLDSKLTISSSVDENKTVLTIQSEDVTALYHLKQHLFLNVDPENEPSTGDEAAHLKILKLQHEIDRFYGAQNTEEEFEVNAQIHLESLLLKYNTIRNTVF
ncbi:uncharacterized protein LOC26527622 [Drosophila mojavensis]|uniref:uncharacterized protein LOC26527622 n=1 Tax=Drosophila mojavensis TaxID=7230 RepID=UPI0013EE43B9|nr:uncharacterized protein LOC26527622 [Drosophila mojavensis]